MNPGSQVRIMEREFPFGLEEQVGQFICSVTSVWSLSADGDCLPVSIAFIERAAGRGNIEVNKLRH